MKLISKTKGMTLVEILLALVLLSVVIVPLGNFFIDSFKFQSRNQRLVQANKAAEYVVESFKNGQATHLLDGAEHNLSMEQFFQEIGVMDQGDIKDYKVNITSTKISNVIDEGTLSVPTSYNGIVTIESSGIEYEGDIELEIDGSELVITDGYLDNNLKIQNNSGSFLEVDLRNSSNEKINVYKDNNVTVNILEGNVFQVNLGKIKDNGRYNNYKITVTAVEENDDSIISKVETTIRILE